MFYVGDQEIDINLTLWDTAGLTIHRRITFNHYERTHGAIFMYDITDRNTFTNIENWIEEYSRHSSDKAVSFLIGNK